jgi:hypothetical protein
LKAAFVWTELHGLKSVLVPKETADAVLIGTRVSITRDLILCPHATITRGEQGTIDYIDRGSGLVEILMDTHHPGLHPWLNHIWIAPYGSEDILDGIKAE